MVTTMQALIGNCKDKLHVDSHDFSLYISLFRLQYIVLSSVNAQLSAAD